MDVVNSMEDHSVESVPLPDEIPTLVHSSSLNTLIGQNADLVSRLHVSLRRLSSIEKENTGLKNQLIDLEKQNHILQDQFLVWKHKENLWMKKIQSLEQFQQEAQTKLEERQAELEGLKTIHQTNEKELFRYKKYHDKIKTHIKPYVQQLKQFAHSLKMEVHGLLRQLENRDFRLNLLEQKTEDLKKELQVQYQKMEQEHSQMVLRFETEKQNLMEENDQLQQSQQNLQKELSEKTQYLDLTNERKDLIENQFIALQRVKVENELQLQNQIHSLKEEVIHLKKNQVEVQLQREVLQKDNENMKKMLGQMESTLSEREVQLSKIRFLWSNKNEELEQLKSSNLDLEQKNIDLLQKINITKTNSNKGDSFL